MELVDVRLQGGPFDGARERHLIAAQMVERIWVVPAPKPLARACLWYAEPVRGAEIYARDEHDDRGWLVYVWEDPNLSGELTTREQELAGATR